MAINGMSVNSGNDANWNNPIDNSQKEQLEKFESIFNRLDKNHDGTIDEKDNLSDNDRQLSYHIKDRFDKLQQAFDFACEFSMRGIKFMLQLVSGSDRKNIVMDELINYTIEADEYLNDDPQARYEKARAVFNSLDKNGDGIINEDDPLSPEEQEKLGTIKNEFSLCIQHTQKGKFNGVDADITYSANNKIIAVKTSATNAKDAARLMGLDRYYNMQESDGTVVKDVPLYYHEVLNKNGKVINRDCFRWDEVSHSMKFDHGVSGGDENSGGFEQIEDYYESW